MKLLLSSAVAVSLSVANIIGSKIISIQIPFFGEATVSVAFLGIGVAFLATDLLSELYGKEVARSAVNNAIALLVFSLSFVYVSIILPSAPFYGLAAEYAAVMQQGLSVFLASIATLLVSQNIDISLFHFLKERTSRKWIRNCVSTGVSQGIDTAMFTILAFTALPYVIGGNVMAMGAVIGIIISEYMIKLIVVALDTPVFYIVSNLYE